MSNAPSIFPTSKQVKNGKKIKMKMVGIFAFIVLSIVIISIIASTPTANAPVDYTPDLPPNEQDDPNQQSYNTYVSGWWDSDPIIIQCISAFGTDVVAIGCDTEVKALLYNQLDFNVWSKIIMGNAPTAKRTLDFISYCSYKSYSNGPYPDWSTTQTVSSIYTGYMIKSMSDINNVLATSIVGLADSLVLEAGSFIYFRSNGRLDTFVVFDNQGGLYRLPSNIMEYYTRYSDFVIFKPIGDSTDNVYIIAAEWFNIGFAAQSGKFTRCTVVLKSDSFVNFADESLCTYFMNVKCTATWNTVV